jgi:hypothetical protein
MSALQTYKEIVSQVYTLTTLVAQGKMTEAGIQFDGFLESLKVALEDKEDHSPYLEIVRDVKPSERIVVVKDDTMKNIVLRTSDSTWDAKGLDMENVMEDEDLEKEHGDQKQEEQEEQEQDGPDEDGGQEQEEEDEDEDEDEEEDVEEFELNGQRYYLAPESKRVFKYIDENTPGDQVGKLMNGHLVCSSNFVSPKGSSTPEGRRPKG